MESLTVVYTPQVVTPRNITPPWLVFYFEKGAAPRRYEQHPAAGVGNAVSRAVYFSMPRNGANTATLYEHIEHRIL